MKSVINPKSAFLGLLLLFCLLSFEFTLAQSTKKIEGYILEVGSSRAVSGAKIQIEGTNYQTISDLRGYFSFENIPPSNYRLKVSSLGYKEKSLSEVSITTDQTLKLTVHLNPDPIPMPEIEVIEKMENLSATTSSNIVLTKEQIQTTNATNIADVLNSVPGVYVRQTSNAGKAYLSIRGSASNQVLVLLNGTALNSGQDGETDLNFIPLNLVEKIEVNKGGQSAFYGTNALAGVINIITNSKLSHNQAVYQIKNTQASFGTGIWDFSVQRDIVPNLDFSLAYNQSHSRGDFEYQDAQSLTQTRENAGKNSENYFLSTAWKKDKICLGLSGQYYEAVNEMPGDTLQLNPLAKNYDYRGIYSLNYNQELKSWWNLEANASYQRWLQKFYDPYSYIKVDANYLNHQSGFEFINNFTFTPQRKIKFGLSGEMTTLNAKDNLRPSQSIGKANRNTGSTYLNWEEKKIFPEISSFLILNSAGRYDRTQGFNSNWSPHFGLLLSQGQNWVKRIKANWGKSYHNPTLNALFWKTDVFAAGNPDLKPERSEDFDLGLETEFPLGGKASLGLTYFNNRVKDIIVWQRKFDGKFMPVNVSKSSLSGWEQNFNWQSPNQVFGFEFNHALTEAINRSGVYPKDGKYLVFRPRHTYNLKFYFNPSPFIFNFNSHWVSKRYIREENTKFLAGYKIVDLKLGFNSKWKKVGYHLSLGVNNFTNQEYELIERYPMPGREYQVSLALEI